MEDYEKQLLRTSRNIEAGLIGKQSKKNEREPVKSSQKSKVLARQHYKCAKCHKLFGLSIHYHHKRFVSKGGKSTTDNLIALCPSCHADLHILEKAMEADKKKRRKTSSSSNFGFKPVKFKAPKFNFP